MNMVVYYESENFQFRVQEHEGLLYMHLDVYKWSHHVVDEIVVTVDRLFAEGRELGHSAIFASTDDKKTVKFWNLIKPYDELLERKEEGVQYLGVWYI